MNVRNFLLRTLGFFVLGSALRSIVGSAPSPEKSTSFAFAFPTFLIWLLFLTAIFCLGAALRKSIQLNLERGFESGLFDLAVGSVSFYVLSYTLTALQLFSSAHSFFLFGILSLFFAWGSPHVNPKRWFESMPTKGIGAKFIFALPWVILILKLIEALQFNQHGDAYITYLPAPRTWASTGEFGSYLKYTQFFLSTSWESLFAWGTALMGLQGGRGLDLSQWFSQWTTAGIGTLGITFGLFALYERLKKHIGSIGIFAPLAVVEGLQTSSLAWTAPLAKNDFGVGFWGVALFYFVSCLKFESAGIAVLIGMLAGAMVMGKMTLVVFGIVLSIQVLIQNPKKFGFYVLGGFIGVAPILIRNLSLTGNPLFPWLSAFFGTTHLLGLSESAGTLGATQVRFSFSFLGSYLYELFLISPYCIALFIVFKKFGRAIASLLTTLILFTLTLRSSTEVRYQGAALILFCFFSVYAALLVARRYRWTKLGLALVILATSNISFYTFAQMFGKKYDIWPKIALKQHDIGNPAKLWIRQHLKPQARILVVGDGYVYYLIDYATTGYSRNREYEELIANNDVAKALKTLSRAPYEYLYLARDADFTKYRETIGQIIKKTSKWTSHCKLYDGAASQVWDLRCLRSF